ncbi:MAG: hypothetical protein ACREAR_06270 [Nitrosotalea sp.]
MISLPAGVKIIKFYDAEMQKTGNGILYLLNNGIMFEKKGEGVKFETNFDYLASFEAVKKNKLLVVIRTTEGRKSVEFKVDTANQVEYDIAQINQEYAGTAAPDSMPDAKNTGKHGKESSFDVESHTKSEAQWFQNNWNDIMKFLKPERVSYLNDYVQNAKIGTPSEDPYLLLVTYEDLTYQDFADLTGFLKWRYPDMTDKESDAIASVFLDFGVDFSVGMLDMDVQICKPLEPKFKKDGYSLYQFVAIIAREKLESAKLRESQPVYSGN